MARPQRRHGPWLAALAAGAAAALVASSCTNICLTRLDQCRGTLDAGLDDPHGPDAAQPRADGGADGGFSACVKLPCRDACQDVAGPPQVCGVPACVSCQSDGGAAAVFCGRLYTCGMDASVRTDASVAPPDAGLDGGVQDASTLQDGSMMDAGPPDSGAPDAATPDAATADASADDAGGLVDGG